ncbi:putative endoplasmic reticulum junction formation protein lunapark [[Candida] railenensis]|uniref:Endoplasmic reticulum junction formation protein lunapark n=1 Tax=[Candida] railenensis TaxID=45579 RepID=A0A9P0QLU4_9ASCO|nr:putative endoplasmic reticulum junction formation protein lunapark [[Candida] railenensis]
MVFGGIFSKKAFDATIFEQELDYLSEQIQDSRTQTLKLESQSKTVRNKVIKFGSLIYVIVFGLIYVNTPDWKPKLGRTRNFFYNQSPAKLVFLVVFPIFIYLLAKLVNRFFRALQNRQRVKYVSLKKRKEAKIDQLKQETNFNSTNKILNKYGNEDDKKGKQTIGTEKKLQSKPANANSAPANPSSLPNSSKIPNTANINSGVPANSVPPQQTPISFSPRGPRARTFQDRLLDAIIGSENNESVENRFALICAQCYHHNGLAPPGCTHPLKVSYVCPYCGFMNGKSGEELENSAIEAGDGGNGSDGFENSELGVEGSSQEPEDIEVILEDEGQQESSTRRRTKKENEGENDDDIEVEIDND